MSGPGPGSPGFSYFWLKVRSRWCDWAQDNTLSDIITISSSDKIGREINDFIAVLAENLSWWPDLRIVFAKRHGESKLFIRSLDSLCGVFSSARRPCHHVINM